MNKSTRLKLYIGGASAGVLLAVLIPILVVFVFTVPRFHFVAGTDDGVRAFSWDADELHSLPTIEGNTTINSILWTFIGNQSQIIQLHSDGSSGDDFTHFLVAPLPANQTVYTTQLRARINHTRGHSYLNFPLEIRDFVFPEFKNLFSPNQTNRIEYRTMGLAQERVFGLWDLVQTDDAIGPNVHRVWGMENRRYQLAGDIMQIATRYAGGLESLILTVETSDDQIIYITSHNFDATKGLENGSRVGMVNMEFRQKGEATIIVRAEHYDTGHVEYYSFTYTIVDAVNAHTFEDVKAIEYLARINYIRHGVKLRGPNMDYTEFGYLYIDPVSGTRTIVNRADATSLIDPLANPTDFYNYRRQGVTLNADNPLNSALFHTGVNDGEAGRRFVRTTANAPVWRIFTSEYLREFSRWTPSFRYRDLVIRNNMQTWEEATWFFGNVYGNGHIIDATPYSSSTARQYRNVHKTGWDSPGKENMSFVPGSGWGDMFAFYGLSNHSRIHNLHMIGQRITHADGRPVRLNEYRNIGVFGTSSLGGYDRDFQIGRRHIDGVFEYGWYNADITLSSSIVERGLILVASSYFSNAKMPFVLENSVMRFSGFTGFFTRGTSGIDPTNVTNTLRAQADPAWIAAGGPAHGRNEGGHRIAVNNTKGIVYDEYGARKPIFETRPNILNQLPQGERNNFHMRFSTFAVLRNVFAYEFTLVPVIIDDSTAEAHIRIEGEDNRLFTWVRVTDLVFPVFGLPTGAGFSQPGNMLAVPDISSMAHRIIRDIMNNPNYAPYAVREGGHIWVNIPIISVGVDSATYMDVYLGGIGIIEIDIGLPELGMGLNASMLNPDTIEKSNGITMEFQREMFRQGNLTREISNWAAGLRG